MNSFVQKAQEVLRQNSRGDSYTVPSGNLYPFQWNWDSGFIALGWSTFDEDRAWREMHHLVRGQWDNGMIPHIIFHQEDDSYMPGPEHWQIDRTPSTSGITQPPVFGSVLMRLYQESGDKGRALEQVKRLFPAAMAFNAWYYRERDPYDMGLVASFHPWETGMDNSPAWDDAMLEVPMSDLPVYVRKDTTNVEAKQRPAKRDYDRYMCLVNRFKKRGYDQQKIFETAPLKVADLCTNCLLLRSDRDLLDLAALLGDDESVSLLTERIERSVAAIQGLWSDRHGGFLNYDLAAGMPIDIMTSASFLPLYAGVATPEQSQSLKEVLNDWMEKVQYVVPSTDPYHPSFESERYWRGPIWINVNWMIARGFEAYGHERTARIITQHTAELIRKNGFWEYYDPFTGGGYGIDTFSWTAALYLYWLKGRKSGAAF